MATQQEILQQGIHREVKMMAMVRLGELTSDLGLIFVRDDEMEMAEACAALVVKLGERIAELNAENLASFQSFEANQAEVDQLEALLALGGEEVQERRPCQTCGEPCVLDDPTDPESWCHAPEANDNADHTADVK